MRRGWNGKNLKPTDKKIFSSIIKCVKTPCQNNSRRSTARGPRLHLLRNIWIFPLTFVSFCEQQQSDSCQISHIHGGISHTIFFCWISACVTKVPDPSSLFISLWQGMYKNLQICWNLTGPCHKCFCYGLLGDLKKYAPVTHAHWTHACYGFWVQVGEVSWSCVKYDCLVLPRRRAKYKLPSNK